MERLFNGGLQIRSEGATEKLLDLRTFLNGDLSLTNLYPEILSTDIPIAQDWFGDQFLIRDDLVIKLMAETGDIEEYNCTWHEFLEWVSEDPIDRLDFPDDLDLECGKLLFAYPPFCTKEGSQAKISVVDGEEVIRFHADFARQINCA